MQRFGYAPNGIGLALRNTDTRISFTLGSKNQAAFVGFSVVDDGALLAFRL
jgi:hypothetical protein